MTNFKMYLTGLIKEIWWCYQIFFYAMLIGCGLFFGVGSAYSLVRLLPH